MENYLKDLIKLLGVGASFAAIPLFLAFADLQPPWPPAIGYLSAAFVLIAALIAWEWVRKSRRSLRRGFIIAGLLLTLIGIGGYLPVYSLYVETVPETGDRVVTGLECTEPAKLVYPDQCPELSLDALRGAEFDSEMLWTRTSVMQVRMMLVGFWLLFNFGLIGLLGAVLAGRSFSNTKSAKATA